MTPAGKRDRLISFCSIATATNAFNEPVDNETYPVLGQEWARIVYGKGDERRAAAVEGTDQPATFIVLANPVTLAVTTKNVIRYQNATWDIVNIAPWERSEIEFTAVRRTP